MSSNPVPFPLLAKLASIPSFNSLKQNPKKIYNSFKRLKPHNRNLTQYAKNKTSKHCKKHDFFSTMTNYQIPSQTIHGEFFSWDPDDCVVGLLLPGNFLWVWLGGGGGVSKQRIRVRVRARILLGSLSISPSLLPVLVLEIVWDS
jgi:hypothetical protein